MARKKNLVKIPRLPIWLLVLLAISFILRIPSFFEPFSYGDEMIYLTLGNAIKNGLTLYQDIHDNKPPLLYFTAAVAGNVFWFRTILAFWMMLATTLFWHLAKTLFPKNSKVVKISTIVFTLLTTLPLLEGQTANAELFALVPALGSFILITKNKPKNIHLFLGGVLFSFAFLYKVPAAFDLGAIVFLWFIKIKFNLKSIKLFTKKTFLLTTGFLLPVLLTLIWYYSKNALTPYVTSAFMQNIGYLSSWRPSDQEKSFLVKNAPLIIRSVVLLSSLLTLTIFRKKLSLPFILSCAWLGFALFAVTLSERPYPHYLIQIVPPVAILVGMLFYQKTAEQSLTIIPLFIAAIVPVLYHFWHYSTLAYYKRFLLFSSGQITQEEYFNRFDGKVNRNYRLATFLTTSTNPNDKVFIWGDSAPIYALSRRLPPFKYVANYHISDFSSKEEVLEMILTKQPAIVILLPESNPFPELITTLKNNYYQLSSQENATIWKKLKKS